MTEQAAKKKLISWLESQVGYRENQVNLTKYADADYDTRLYSFDMNGQPWCDYFVDYAFIVCFGYDLGTRMTYQDPAGSAACAISAGYFRQNGAFFQAPEIGDQIFFYSGGGINHTGIVVDLTDMTVTTIEGNSSDAVRCNNYYRTDSSIAGYGRPRWALLSNEIEDVQGESSPVNNSSVIAKVMNGPTPLLTVTYANNYLCATEALQCLLQLREIGKGVEISGYYDQATADAVRQAQARYGLLEDGECGRDTWYALIMN